MLTAFLFSLLAAAFTTGKLNAQALKLDIQGITYQEDTIITNENIIAHTAISVKKTEKSRGSTPAITEKSPAVAV